MKKSKWKKGALHCHTMWSDGRTMPEAVIKTYMDNGYDFVCLSDHNIFQEEENCWIRVRPEEGPWPPDLSIKEYERIKKLLPENCLVEKDISYKKFLRLKTFDELKKEWEIEGEFLLVPGSEITTGGEDFNIKGRIHALHYNLFNHKVWYNAPTGGDALALTGKALALYKKDAGENSFFMLNHPFYVLWDADPAILIEYEEIRFFEINNSGSSLAPENWIYEREKYWDYILAHRLSKGKGVVYGTSTDDAHMFDPERAGKSGYFDTGFVMVQLPYEEEFTIENIVKSMNKGNFYGSCGVMLEEVEFDKNTNTLSVKAEEEEDVDYQIDFIVTKKDFDSSIEIKEFPFEKNPAFSRTLPVIRDDVGITAKRVNASQGTYTLQKDDLYVRAIITSTKKSRLEKISFYPEFECAWTQPYTLQK